MPRTDSKEHRALRHLSEVGLDYPKFQDQYTLFRQDREALGGWPEYVYCPLAGAYAVVSGGGNRRVSPEKAADILRGPRDGERERFVKWLPPIGVNLALDELESAPSRSSLSRP